LLVVNLRAQSKRALGSLLLSINYWSRASFMLEHLTVFPWIFEARVEVSSARASFIIMNCWGSSWTLAQLEPHLLLWIAEARAEVNAARASLLF